MTAEEAATRLELRALVDDYAWALDRGDREAYAGTFTDDGELTLANPGESEPSFRLKGRDELRSTPRRASSRYSTRWTTTG